jgi:hypothetical protein
MALTGPTSVIPGIKYKLAAVALLLTSLSMFTRAIPVATPAVPFKIGTVWQNINLAAPHVPVRIGTPLQSYKPTSLEGNTSTTLTLLEARAPPTSYRSAVKKGREMWAIMDNPLRTRQSIWTATDMQTWGWSVKSDKNVEVYNDKTSGLEAALAVLQASPATSLTIRLEHNRDVTVINGVEYPATNAEYCGIYNPAKGIIIASDRHSPSYRKATSSHLSKNSPLPQLQYWSDLTYLSYQLLSSANSNQKEQVSPLRYIFIRGITKRASQQIIREALQSDGYQHKDVLPWPSFWMFTPNGVDGRLSEAFLAVLGTENFAGIAPLLGQYQQGFGKRSIKSIRVWGDGGRSSVLHGMVELG